jgi:hypothetical protein
MLKFMPSGFADPTTSRGSELGSTPSTSRARALANTAGYVVLVGLALYSIGYLLSERVDPVDFHVYRHAAEDIAAGESPYPWFAYPPLSALAAVPFTVVSAGVADLAVKALLVLGVFAVLGVAGVRDWRCYPLAILWPSVNAAVQTGNITIPLAVAAALLWRFRERPLGAGLAWGEHRRQVRALAPVALAGRRKPPHGCGLGVASAVAITLVTWAVIDFQAMLEYPERAEAL